MGERWVVGDAGGWSKEMLFHRGLCILCGDEFNHNSEFKYSTTAQLLHPIWARSQASLQEQPRYLKWLS